MPRAASCLDLVELYRLPLSLVEGCMAFGITSEQLDSIIDALYDELGPDPQPHIAYKERFESDVRTLIQEYEFAYEYLPQV